uniref:Mammalian defensins domain-containing protein n=1 Tax=Piliocolobus tephrosceles TaxID=591936 RepID=A0A8C9GA41_9PRIM
ILAAILLFALLAQAESLQETANNTATQEQPGKEDQDLAVSFEENGLSTLRASVTCYCRTGCCLLRETYSGTCYISGRISRLCCR